jgi:hypothetical protein
MLVSSSSEGSPIAALRGASSAEIQRLMAKVAEDFARAGVRVGGVIEIAEPAAASVCGRLTLRDLSTGALIPISQDLGPGSQACNLDGRGVVAACAAVEDAVARGVDLLVLSKFGKLEAARGGLYDAFRAAVASDTPVLTAVSPAMSDAWAAFAGSLSHYLPPEREAVESWWRRRVARAWATAAE